MASNFPKLPGYVPTHDPTNVCHKKVSHIKLEEIRNAKNVAVPLHALPRQIERQFLPDKTDPSKSLSHMQYPNHNGEDIREQFEPTFVKLDKQVSPTPSSKFATHGWPATASILEARYNFINRALINIYIIGSPILWILQGKRCRIQVRKLQN